MEREGLRSAHQMRAQDCHGEAEAREAEPPKLHRAGKGPLVGRKSCEGAHPEECEPERSPLDGVERGDKEREHPEREPSTEREGEREAGETSRGGLRLFFRCSGALNSPHTGLKGGW